MKKVTTDARLANTPPKPSTAPITRYTTDPFPSTPIVMQPTTFNTLLVPGAGSNTRPICIATATKVPVRVVVDNISAITLFLGATAQDVYTGSGPGTAVYRLSSGEVRTFVLAPKQSLFCAGSGAAANVSISVSEAYPVG